MIEIALDRETAFFRIVSNEVDGVIPVILNLMTSVFLNPV
jgi:hypothetical protein